MPSVTEPGGTYRRHRLLDVCLALSAETDLDALLTYIIETAAETLGCEAAAILLYDEAAHRLRFAASTGTDAETLARIPVPLDGSIAGTIFRENRPVQVDDPAQDRQHYRAVGEAVAFQPKALLGVPLRLKDDPIGVLEVLNPIDGCFAPDALDTLAIIAAQAAVAVRNAQQQQALERAYDDLSRLDRMKSEFMAVASHELRTPLAAVLGYAALLRDEMEGELADMATTVHEAAQRAAEVVETMALLSEQASESNALDGTAPVAMREVVQEAVARVASAAQQKGQRIEVMREVDAACVEAKHEPLVHALQAVLDNAIAFSPDNAPIRVRLVEDGDYVMMTVQDQGRGLSEADCTRVFEAFYQVEDSLTRTHEGTGLGLTLAQQQVTRYGGHLAAQSAGPGHGCTFVFRLPVLRSSV